MQHSVHFIFFMLVISATVCYQSDIDDNEYDITVLTETKEVTERQIFDDEDNSNLTIDNGLNGDDESVFDLGSADRFQTDVTELLEADGKKGNFETFDEFSIPIEAEEVKRTTDSTETQITDSIDTTESGDTHEPRADTVNTREQFDESSIDTKTLVTEDTIDSMDTTESADTHEPRADTVNTREQFDDSSIDTKTLVTEDTIDSMDTTESAETYEPRGDTADTKKHHLQVILGEAIEKLNTTINQLTNRLEQFDAKVDHIENTINHELEDINGNIPDLDNRVRSITTDVNKMSVLISNLNNHSNAIQKLLVNIESTWQQTLIRAVSHEKDTIKAKLKDLQNQYRDNRQLTKITELISSIDRVTSVDSLNLHLLNSIFEIQVVMIKDTITLKEMKQQSNIRFTMIVVFVTILAVVQTVVVWYLCREKLKPNFQSNSNGLDANALTQKLSVL